MNQVFKTSQELRSSKVDKIGASLILAAKQLHASIAGGTIFSITGLSK
jgi:hypothetical protein